MNKDKIINALKSKPALVVYGLLVGSIIFGPTSEQLDKINGYDDLKLNYDTVMSETEVWRSLSEKEKEIKEQKTNQEHAKIEEEKKAADKEAADKLAEELRKSKEGTTVYEDDRVKINFIKATKSGIEFLAENKTNATITFQADSFAINGLSTNDITMSDDVTAQSKGKITARCSVEDINVETISGQFRVIDFNKSFKTYDASFVNISVK